MEKLSFIAKDGKKICYRVWRARNPKGLLQISHGMAESPVRYDGFAEFMNENGFTVFSDDQRAHGDTDNCSGYCKGDNFSDTISDMAELNAIMRKEYPTLKLVFFGHSYGSFLAQAFLEEHGDIVDGFILGGSAYMAGATAVAGSVISGVNCFLGRSKKPAKLLAQMSFGSYNKKYKDGTTFISSIPKECDSYNKNPECGFILSYNFYRYMFKAFGRIYKKKNYQKIDPDKKVLIISGKDDPVGGFGKLTKKLYDFYINKVKMQNVELLFYDGGVRHEYLNDTSKEGARKDILNFCENI